MRLVIAIVAVAMVAAALITAAFGNDEPPSPGAVVEFIRGGDDAAGTTQTATPAGNANSTPPVTGTPATPTVSLPERVSGLAFPIAGACLPETDELMPGAPREYRQGVHEGVDFYESDNCVAIGMGTEVLAAQTGTVVRADSVYQDLTAETLAELLERIDRGESNDPEVLDAFRGRQVWVDDGDGLVTRYAHLSGIADGVAVGAKVKQGAIIGYVGDSGTPESVTSPGTEAHLHFEVRVGDSYLGEGLDPDAVRRLYEQAFSP